MNFCFLPEILLFESRSWFSILFIVAPNDFAVQFNIEHEHVSKLVWMSSRSWKSFVLFRSLRRSWNFWIQQTGQQKPLRNVFPLWFLFLFFSDIMTCQHYFALVFGNKMYHANRKEIYRRILGKWNFEDHSFDFFNFLSFSYHLIHLGNDNSSLGNLRRNLSAMVVQDLC